MAKKRANKTAPEQAVIDYRHEDAKRNNIPPAGLAAQGKIKEKPKIQYACNPHLPPILRFDKTGKADGLPELLETARSRPLTLEKEMMLTDGRLCQHSGPCLISWRERPFVDSAAKKGDEGEGGVLVWKERSR